MATITIHKAKTNLSKLIARALAGEEIVIARGKQPVVKLVPLGDQTGLAATQGGLSEAPTPFATKQKYEVAKKRGYGALKEELGEIPDEAFAPLTEDELKAWYGD